MRSMVEGRAKRGRPAAGPAKTTGGCAAGPSTVLRTLPLPQLHWGRIPSTLRT
jgi:hypothetical protein